MICPRSCSFTFVTAVDTSQPTPEGSPIEVVVNVTYPDGSVDQVNVNITVTNNQADENTLHASLINVNKGETPSAEDAIANKEALPENTTYEFKETVDTTTPGDKPATVVVNYPDGSSEEVDVTVHVNSDAEVETPETQQVTVNKGETPSAEDAIANKEALPENTTYEFKETVDTTTPR